MNKQENMIINGIKFINPEILIDKNNNDQTSSTTKTACIFYNQKKVLFAPSFIQNESVEYPLLENKTYFTDKDEASVRSEFKNESKTLLDVIVSVDPYSNKLNAVEGSSAKHTDPLFSLLQTRSLILRQCEKEWKNVSSSLTTLNGKPVPLSTNQNLLISSWHWDCAVNLNSDLKDSDGNKLVSDEIIKQGLVKIVFDTDYRGPIKFKTVASYPLLKLLSEPQNSGIRIVANSKIKIDEYALIES